MKLICYGTFLFLSASFLCGCGENISANQKMAQAVHQAKQGNWKAAEKNAAELAAKSPKAAAPMLLNALAFEKKGDLDKALDLARKCALTAPDDFTVQYTFGRLLSKDRMRNSEAFAVLDKALTLNPGDTDTLILLCNLGTVLKHPDAEKYLKQLLMKKEFSRSAQLYYQLALRYADNKQAPQAVACMKKAVTLGGGMNPDLILSAARCIDQNGFSSKDAVTYYRFYCNHPKTKSPEKIAEAKKRIYQLSGRK